jgi:signal peptidase I
METTLSNEEPKEAGTQEGLRRQACRRSHFCPGLGLALLGHPLLGMLGIVAALLPALAILYLTFASGAPALWLFIAGLLVYLVFYALEQFLCGRIAIRPEGQQNVLARKPINVCVGAYLVYVAALCIGLFNLGVKQLQGQGMTPTVLPGERFLYRKYIYPEDLRAGHLVLFQTAADSGWGQGGDEVLGRILAVPGDRLAIAAGHYVVNGKQEAAVAPVGAYRPRLEIPQAPATLIVPPNCYFIVQDNAQDSLDSRILSWARKPDLIATRALLLSRREFGKELE